LKQLLRGVDAQRRAANAQQPERGQPLSGRQQGR
jgi:hypothetical protein